MRFGVIFIETENFWQPSGDKIISKGVRWNVERGVEFETDSLDTAKAIAIGFANFFTETDFPNCDWQQFNCYILSNKQKFPTCDETGFIESQLSFEIRLISLKEKTNEL